MGGRGCLDTSDKMVIWPELSSSLQSRPYNEQNCRLEDKTEIGSEVQNDKTLLITSFQSTRIPS